MSEFDREIFNFAEQVLGQRQPGSDLPPAETKVKQQAPRVTVEAQPDPADVSKGKSAIPVSVLSKRFE